MQEHDHLLQPELPLEYSTASDLTQENLETSRAPLQAHAPLYGEPQWEMKEIIRSQADLVSLAKKLGSLPCFPIDTETFGLGDEAINKRLSLIQIGIPEKPGDYDSQTKGATYLIDVLALEEESERLAEEYMMPPPNPLAALKEVLENPRITKIAQNAIFEQDQLDKYGISLDGIADTMVLARTIVPYIKSKALNALTVEFMGQSLDKDQQKSAWGRRPLTQRQEIYAYLDPEVTYRVWLEERACMQEGRVDKRFGPERIMKEYQKQQEELVALRRPVHDELAEAAYRIDQIDVKTKQLLFSDLSERVDTLTAEIQAVLHPCILETDKAAAAARSALFSEFRVDLVDPKKLEKGTIQFLKGDPESRLLDLLEQRLDEGTVSVSEKSMEALRGAISRLRSCFDEQRHLTEEERENHSFEIEFRLPQYRTPFGSVGMAQYDDTYADVDQLKALMPDVAERIIFESLTKTDLDRGLREAGMKKKDRDIIIESVTVEGPLKETFFFSPHNDGVYSDAAPAFPTLIAKGKVQTITTAAKLKTFANLCMKSDTCSVAVHTNDDGLPISIEIGLPQKKGSVSVMQQCAVIDVQKLAGVEPLTADACDAVLQELSPLMASPTITKVLYDERGSKRALKFGGLTLEATVDLEAYLATHRPDMIAYSPQACAVELFSKHVAADDTKNVHEVMLASFQQVKKDIETARSYTEELIAKQDSYAAKMECLMESLLTEEAKRASLLRSLGTPYQIATVKAQELQERLQEKVERKYQSQKGKTLFIEDDSGISGVRVEETREIDIDAVRDQYPFIEALEIEDNSSGQMRPVIRERFQWGDLDVELKQLAEGLLKPKMRDAIKDELRIEAGYQAPRYYVYPKYSLLY